MKMKKITSSHPLKSKLWLALIVGAVSISACSNEVEETPNNTMEPTETVDTTDTVGATDTMGTADTMGTTESMPMETGQGTDTSMTAPTDMEEPVMDPAGTGTMTDSAGNTGSVTGDTTMIDEENTSFNQQPQESTQ